MGDTPPPPLTPAPRLNCHSLLNHSWVKTSLCVWTAFVYVCLHLVVDWFFDTDENEYYFPFILFVSYVIFIIYVCPGLVTPPSF